MRDVDCCRSETGTDFRTIARTLIGMATNTKTKAKVKTCVHCGHTFDPSDRWRDLSDPAWHPAASVYCSRECSDRYHCEMVHCCSTHRKGKARREAAKAAR
jgi:hypothetical protein